MSTVVIPSDFKLPIGIAAFGLAITGLGNVNVGFPISIVGLLLAFQATRVNFEFDDVVGGERGVGNGTWGGRAVVWLLLLAQKVFSLLDCCTFATSSICFCRGIDSRLGQIVSRLPFFTVLALSQDDVREKTAVFYSR